ncbi:methyl-accepting chemotaxis protein [Paenibacillus algorifonticola]|uniref:Methyl-accepting chemotaxis protein n=1 Tax=Paenibacillus algorifonticola TaxID=684063 RepID=A0A1I2AK17_9BACL|nr:methyl-accepting chemotaxis protein [Paenibacillus algorifonticola]SFE44364.1 methyl-accepting chemotaxis protein [Paenibacillus algorifonticola]
MAIAELEHPIDTKPELTDPLESSAAPKESPKPTVVSLQHMDIRLAVFMRQGIMVKDTQTCREAAALFKRNPGSECIVICNTNEYPVGLMMRNRFFMRQSSRFSAELYDDKAVGLFMDDHPIMTDLNDNPQQLIDEALSRPDESVCDCVIVTAEGKLAGILTAPDLLRISRELQRAEMNRQMLMINSVSTSLSEIEEVVGVVQQSSRVGETISAKMLEFTFEGKKELDKVKEAFSLSAANSLQQEQRINELQGETSSISHISRLIGDLAEQSNLLAINASIEAARAGIHGRGFAIVAGEVMKLAGETKRSADQITRMTQKIIAAIAGATALAREGRANAASSETYVMQAGEAFARLFHAATDNRDSSESIGKLSQQAYAQTVQAAAEIEHLLDSYF